MATEGCAKVDVDGRVTALGVRPGADSAITAEDVQDAPKLARIVGSLVSGLSTVRARWFPRTIDFEDVTVVTSGVYRFQHNFNGRVRWWPVDWTSETGVPPTFIRRIFTDENTLELGAFEDGVVTIRVEEAG